MVEFRSRGVAALSLANPRPNVESPRAIPFLKAFYCRKITHAGTQCEIKVLWCNLADIGKLIEKGGESKKSKKR